MNTRTAMILGALVAIGIGGSTLPEQADAASNFGPFNMMNPSKWFATSSSKGWISASVSGAGETSVMTLTGMFCALLSIASLRIWCAAWTSSVQPNRPGKNA